MNNDMLMPMTLLINSIGMAISFYGWKIWPRIKSRRAEKQYKFNIDELNKYDGYLINKECFLDKATLKDKNESMNKKKLEVIYPYVEILANEVPEEDLKLMYTNLKTLKLKKKSKIHLLFYVGEYLPEKQAINYVNKESLGHELLHLSSSYYNEITGVVESGFAQKKVIEGKKETVFIGNALTEGYTELLNIRYFKKGMDTYSLYVRLARLLELFFADSRDMERLYFHHDLPGFVNYMSQFMPYKKAIDLLTTLDKILIYEDAFPNEALKDFTNLKWELYEYFKATNMDEKKRELFERILDDDNLEEDIALYSERMSNTGQLIDFEREKSDARIKWA